MLIVDAQIHLWEKGTPSAHHRQEPYSAEQAIAGMDEAGVDRALIHPVLWDPDSNELAVEAVRKYPGRLAIMGWFYLDDPNGRDLVAHWRERPGMLGLRFYTNERHPQSWFTDGTLDWLWPAAERAQVPVALGAAMFLPTVGKIAERHAGLKLIVDHMGVPRASKGEAAYRFQPELLALARYPKWRSRRRGRQATREEAVRRLTKGSSGEIAKVAIIFRVCPEDQHQAAWRARDLLCSHSTSPAAGMMRTTWERGSKPASCINELRLNCR
jgi:predicted TIM-barrel fold metal-dependent hydrolase